MPVSTEERLLISKVIRRDREAFARMYVQYHDNVVNRVLPLTHSRDEAKDVASETFLRAWNAIDRFEDRDVSIAAWLCKIGERVALKRLRRNGLSSSVDSAQSLASEGDSLEDLTERDSERLEVRSALEELPELQRLVLKRRFYDEASYASLSCELGKSVGAVRVIQHRGLAALRKILAVRHQEAGSTGR